jgi:hypothetical protein
MGGLLSECCDVEDVERIALVSAERVVVGADCHMFALLPNSDIRQRDLDVRFGSKAEVTPSDCDVRFTPESRHSSWQSECQLSAISRHRVASSDTHFA